MNHDKPKSDRPGQEPVTDLQLEQDDLVIFGEDGRFHHVPKSYYADPRQRLPDKYRSAPEFAVGMGTVISDLSVYTSVHAEDSVQARMTADCACFVLNLKAVRQASEKATGPLTELENGRLRESPPPPLGNEGAPMPRIEKDDLVIFGEDGKFYLVKKSYYEQQILPDDMKSAPQLMVELGTVVADIPRLPTAGSACQLVNLASIRMGSAGAARLIRSQKEPSQAPTVQRTRSTRRGSEAPGRARRSKAK
jgi:hypothetical protein